MNDAEFLEMCRLAAGPDTGGRWTEEKIDAIEEVNVDPRGAVRRLYGMLAAERARAAASARALDDLHVMLSCLPEYMRYCNDIEGPTLTLAEWWSAQPDEVQP